MQYIHTKDAPEALGPYNQAVVHGGLVYTSGQIAIDPTTNKVIVGSIQDEIDLVMRNLQAVLSAAGSDFSKVIKSTIFVKDMNDFDAINTIYGGYMQEGQLPARETVQVAKLPKDVHVEISMIAVI